MSKKLATIMAMTTALANDMAEYATVKFATSPIYTPKKHTVESYRSQQRKAKQRRNNRCK
jgi:hypothetical protein